jgi:hypothetical protein
MRGGVFVCHASTDAGMAQRAVEVLEAAGVACWIAPRDIEPGENYTQAILDALDDAPAIVLIFSSATNDSPHVTRELESAVGSGKRIIPVRLEDVEPSRALRYFIGTSQWLDASGPADSWWSPSLVRAVRRAIGQTDGEPAPVVPERPAPVPTRGLAPPPAPAPAAPVPAAPAAASSPEPGRSPWTGRSAALVGASLVAAVVVAVVIAVSLSGGGEPSSADNASTTGDTTGASQQTPQARSSASAVNTGPVTCWDGSQADAAATCPIPTGRAGMATVFPGLDDSCTQVVSPIEGKAEVYECLHNGFIVRYTRWDVGFDKERYYDVENQVAHQDWQVDGEDAGLQWFSIENDPSEEQPYQWSGAYAGLPFSLSVEGETESDRSAGLAQLDLVRSSQIGLAR